MRKRKKNVDLGEWGSGEDLGELGRGETKIKIEYIV